MIFSEQSCKRWIVRNEGKGAYQGIADFGWCTDWYVASKSSVSEMDFWDRDRTSRLSARVLFYLLVRGMDS